MDWRKKEKELIWNGRIIRCFVVVGFVSWEVFGSFSIVFVWLILNVILCFYYFLEFKCIWKYLYRILQFN